MGVYADSRMPLLIVQGVAMRPSTLQVDVDWPVRFGSVGAVEPYQPGRPSARLRYRDRRGYDYESSGWRVERRSRRSGRICLVLTLPRGED